MASDFTIDTSALDRALLLSPEAAGKGAATALKDIKNDWQAESVDAAPIDTSNLRQQIKAEVFEPGASGRVEIYANAKRNGFNYAYYIHEENAGGRAILSGEKKFLDKPAEESIDKWTKWLEDEVKAELRKAGW